jgi:hypothetical protein
MTALMALCSLLALVSYLLLARPASASSCRFERIDSTLPSLSDFDVLTVVGGPISANNEAQLGLVQRSRWSARP